MTRGDPRETVAAVERRAETFATPCGNGEMIWRAWGDGPPLLLLHGAFGSWTHWLLNIDALSTRYRVLAPDMPGYGASAMPPPPLDAAGLAAAVARGVETALPGDTRFALAGFSFGGIVAGHLAARLVGRVSHLVLIGPNGMALPIPEIPPLQGLSAEMTEAEVAAVHRHNLGRIMLADPARVDGLAVHLQMRNARQSRFKSGDIPRSDSLLRVLPEVTARLSGIWGGADALAGPGLPGREATLRRFQPDLEFRVVPGAGHWVPYETPDATNSAMLEMLARPGATA